MIDIKCQMKRANKELPEISREKLIENCKRAGEGTALELQARFIRAFLKMRKEKV